MSVRRGSTIIAGLPIIDGSLNTSSVNPIANGPVASAVNDLSGRIDEITGGGDLVHRSQNEEITGTKTFTSTIKSTVRSSVVPNNVISVSHEQLADSFVDLIGLYDTANSCRCATIRAWNTPTIHGIILGANNFDNGAPTGVGVQYNNNGDFVTTAHTPTSTNSNNTEIATTAWVKSLLGNHYCVEYQAPTSANNWTWYRKYADGWIEQGGQYSYGASCGNRVYITYPKTMANNMNWIHVTRPKGVGDVQAYDNDGVESQDASGFTSAGFGAGNSATNSFIWEVRGVAA